ncbi:MAG: helix-turn-helix domain-containing protein [Candidatus Saccharimonadales bacterium]
MSNQARKSKADKQPTLGETLRAAREEAGLSKLQLEATSGVGRMNISRLESDWYQEPPSDDLIRLARALELNETDLFLIAGLPIPKEAASLDIMLRKGYGVTDEELPELKRQIEALIAKHHQEPSKRKAKGGQQHDQDN